MCNRLSDRKLDQNLGRRIHDRNRNAIDIGNYKLGYCWRIYNPMLVWLPSQICLCTGITYKGIFDRIALLQQNDDYIMLRFIEHINRRMNLYILNQMRMSLHAISLLDITTSDGFKILQNAFLFVSSNSLYKEYK